MTGSVVKIRFRLLMAQFILNQTQNLCLAIVLLGLRREVVYFIRSIIHC